MGYIIVLILGGVAVVGIIVAILGGEKRPVGKARPGDDVTVKQPAAEEATPAASDVATNSQATRAQQRTPPA